MFFLLQRLRVVKEGPILSANRGGRLWWILEVCLGVCISLSERGDQVAGEEIAYPYEPYEENGREDKRFGAGLFEFSEVGFNPDCGHCHGKREGIGPFDALHHGIWERDERVDNDSGEETDDEPRDKSSFTAVGAC